MHRATIKRPVHAMRNCASILSRRRFCQVITAIPANFALANLSFGVRPRSKITLDDGFLIINGWVLTREDIEAEFNVI